MKQPTFGSAGQIVTGNVTVQGNNIGTQNNYDRDTEAAELAKEGELKLLTQHQIRVLSFLEFNELKCHNHHSIRLSVFMENT